MVSPYPQETSLTKGQYERLRGATGSNGDGPSPLVEAPALCSECHRQPPRPGRETCSQSCSRAREARVRRERRRRAAKTTTVAARRVTEGRERALTSGADDVAEVCNAPPEVPRVARQTKPVHLTSTPEPRLVAVVRTLTGAGLTVFVQIDDIELVVR